METAEAGAHDASSTAGQELEPAAFYSKSALNTVDDVVGFGSGPGTEMLHGSIDNTAIFKLVRDQL
jgi:alkaline phosphatase